MRAFVAPAETALADNGCNGTDRSLWSRWERLQSARSSTVWEPDERAGGSQTGGRSNGPSGKREQVVSIEDVARRAGVSVATVSRALRGLPNVADATRLRVEAAARDLDYVSSPSAARLAAGRTGVLGLVLPGLGNWYQARVMAKVHEVWNAASHDLLAIVVDDHSERDRFVRDLPFRKRVDGLLIVDVPFAEDEFARLAGACPALVTTGARSAGLASVAVDDRGGAHALVQHLVALGHRDIALLTGSINEPFRFSGPTERAAGVTEALDAAGIHVPSAWNRTVDWTSSDAVVQMQRVLAASGTPPTAVLCFSDDIAVGAISALRAGGLRVPEDVSVTGFDDQELAGHLGLTTVHQPVDSLARHAAELVVARVTDPDAEPSHEVLPTRLVVRGSTAAPRAQQTSPSTQSSGHAPARNA